MKFTTIANAKKQTDLAYLGNINSSAKLVKNKKVSNNYTYIIYLAPYNLSGYNVCPHSTPECRLGCLNTSGRVKMEMASNRSVIQDARITKTKLFFEHNTFFLMWLVAEMKSFQAKAKRDGYAFSARLNGTSDIEWENYKLDGKNIFQHFPDVQFYDYTKNAARLLKPLAPNYQLTYSYTGRNNSEKLAQTILSKGQNVAVIYNQPKGSALPKTWNGYPVIDGDLTDYRPNDGKGVVVGLRWKNIGNKEANEQIRNSCFVTQVVNIPY